MAGTSKGSGKPGRAVSVLFAAGCGTATVLVLGGNYWGAAWLTGLTFWVAYGLLDLERD